MHSQYLDFQSGIPVLDCAWRIALADLENNIRPYQSGLLEKPAPCIMAGQDYNTPWTRDAAINVWNGCALIEPAVSRNTLLSVLQRDDQGRLFIGGEYWDAIIWVTGAWSLYNATLDRGFLMMAIAAGGHSLARFEREEFDPGLGLFRGGACFQDGVAAYPDIYARPHYQSGIMSWPAANPELRHPQGAGLPMHACSTNCLYEHAYRLLALMTREAGDVPEPQWERKADALRRAIKQHFWDDEKGNLRYLVDPFGGCDCQEGMGSAFAVLFDIVTPQEAARIFQSQHLTPHGIPCLWPTFDRYSRLASTPPRRPGSHRSEPGAASNYGRHSGTIWPQVNGLWAEAALRNQRADLFEQELLGLAAKVERDGQFAEIYHPATGRIYGGLQECGGKPDGIVEWESCKRQTWCATAFLRMILYGVCGLRPGGGGLHVQPNLPSGTDCVALTGLPFQGKLYNLEVRRQDDSGNPAVSMTTAG